MWEHYRKTFVGTQLVIALVVACVFVFFGRNWRAAATFLAVMEFSAVLGAGWAARIRAKLERRRVALPLEPR